MPTIHICSKPFKGCNSYEWQFLNIVFQLMYPYSDMQPSLDHYYFHVSIDSAWRLFR